MDRKDYVEILKVLDNISFNTAVIKWILIIAIIVAAIWIIVNTVSYFEMINMIQNTLRLH